MKENSRLQVSLRTNSFMVTGFWAIYEDPKSESVHDIDDEDLPPFPPFPPLPGLLEDLLPFPPFPEDRTRRSITSIELSTVIGVVAMAMTAIQAERQSAILVLIFILFDVCCGGRCSKVFMRPR